jgi:hypothetical protein
MIMDGESHQWRHAVLGLVFIVSILYIIWLVGGFSSLVCIAIVSIYAWAVLILFMRLYKFHPFAARFLAVLLFLPLAIILQKCLSAKGKKAV